jgi:hypothetical protein
MDSAINYQRHGVQLRVLAVQCHLARFMRLFLEAKLAYIVPATVRQVDVSMPSFHLAARPMVLTDNSVTIGTGQSSFLQAVDHGHVHLYK